MIDAYSIDTESCKGEQLAVMRLGVAEAFSLADYAVQAIQNGARDQDVGRLVNLLFGNNADLRTVTASFRGILDRNTNRQTSDPAMEDEEEIVCLVDFIFCALPLISSP